MSRINKYVTGDCLIKTIHQTQGLSTSPSVDCILLLASLSFEMLPQCLCLPESRSR